MIWSLDSVPAHHDCCFFCRYSLCEWSPLLLASWTTWFFIFPKLFSSTVYTAWCCLLFFFFKFIYLFILRRRETVHMGEEQRERETENPEVTPHSQHRARSGAWTHKPRDHDLIRTKSLTLNRLSYPGAPFLPCFSGISLGSTFTHSHIQYLTPSFIRRSVNKH